MIYTGGKTFNMIDEHGKEYEAKVIKRMKVKDTDLEYLIYLLPDETDTRDVPEEEKKVLILAARIEKNDNGEEELVDLDNENERIAVFEAFNEFYKRTLSE